MIPKKLPIAYLPDLHTALLGKHDHGLFWCMEWPGPEGPVVLFLFSEEGHFVSAQFSFVEQAESHNVARGFVDRLDNPTFEDISVVPFMTRHKGVDYGLEARESVVTLVPHAVISFHPPWDGEYFT